MQLQTFGTWTGAISGVGAGALTASPETQFLAPYVAIASAAIWVALLILFLVSNRREIRSGIGKLGSFYFIIPCIALAILSIGAAAYGLGLRSASGPVTLSKGEPANAAPSSVVKSAPTLLISPDRFYSRAEKERIVDTMNYIHERFAQAGYPIMYDADAAFNEVSKTSTPANLDSLIGRMATALKTADTLDKDIDKIRNESQSYAMDFAYLLRAKPVYLETFREALSDFTNTLSVYRNLSPTAGSQSEPLRKTLVASSRNLARTKHGFEKWMQDCEEEMRKARQQLSQ